MNAVAKMGLLATAAPLFVGLGGKSLLQKSAQASLVRSLQERPYTERDLATEYGLERYDASNGSSGPLAYMSTAGDAVKRNNMLEAEASRIQLEFESTVGVTGVLLSGFSETVRINPSEIARQRFEDQGLLPKKQAAKAK
jgi:hypothetical protein